MRLNSMIQAVDLHACGEPGRVIVGGVPAITGFAQDVPDPEDPFSERCAAGDIRGGRQ